MIAIVVSQQYSSRSRQRSLQSLDAMRPSCVDGTQSAILSAYSEAESPLPASVLEWDVRICPNSSSDAASRRPFTDEGFSRNASFGESIGFPLVNSASL